MKHLILDMDLTIIDRSKAGNYNNKKESITSYCKKIQDFTIYDGWTDVFAFVKENNFKIAIVSDAHASIIKGVISRFKIPCKIVIGHFEAKGKKKPNPFPMNEALRMMNKASPDVISVGDSLKDFRTATEAGINHYACLWASKEEKMLIQNGCTQFIRHPSEIIEILKAS